MLDVKKLLTKILSTINTNYIRAKMSANQTLGSGNTVTLNLNTVIDSNGSKLTLNTSTHEVVIGADVNFVEVTGQIYVMTNGSSGAKNVYIYKNSTEIGTALINMTNNYNVINTIPFIIPVQQGDKITLRAKGASNTVISSGETQLSVRVLS